jgi:tRNA A-37 threonylcarbamoyl transferase component Bud32
MQIHNNRTVFALKLPSTPIPDWLLSWVPRQVQQQLERRIPEWFLPRNLILKEKNANLDKLNKHEHEIRIYQQLSSLQGRCIPRLYGEAFSDDGVPALVLQHIQGIPLNELNLEQLISPRALEALQKGYWSHQLPLEELPNPGLLSALRKTYYELTANGIVHGDPKLDNFILVGEEVVAIDFERSSFLPGNTTNEEDLLVIMDEIEEVIEAKAPKVRTSPGHWIPLGWSM